PSPSFAGVTPIIVQNVDSSRQVKSAERRLRIGHVGEWAWQNAAARAPDRPYQRAVAGPTRRRGR
ncbi:MAG: hypothetical protein ABSD78_09415, partial [Acidimicrobiales bacterium]